MILMKSIAQINYSDLSEINQVAGNIFNLCKHKKIWAFEGEMGAGKTTLIKNICLHAGVTDNVTSPTFSIVNEYYSPQFGTFYHFDFYRIKNESEALDIGLEEYFDSGDFCFIEWPTKSQSLLPKDIACVKITMEGQSRKIEIFNESCF
jgi:tRNA threonylcarbamoyladenosine biosynthesis protein TsaE